MKERMKIMKKILKSLPFQLLLGVIIGIVLGLISNEAVMNVIVTIKFVLGELINFCVPLIVIGFIAPSITKLGKNASRILGVAVLLAYVSSVLAALGSMAAGYGLIPHLSIVSEVDGLKELPEIVFQLEIPLDHVRDECPCIFHSDGACGNMDKSRDSDPAIR